METVYVYADIVVLVSIVISVPILWSVARMFALKFKVLRATAAALLCGTVTVFEIVFRLNYVEIAVVALVVFMLMILISFGKMRLKLFVCSVIMLLAENVFLVGICEEIYTVFAKESGYVGVIGVFIGVILLVLTARLKKSAHRISVEALSVQSVLLSLKIGSTVSDVTATIDSGNLLTEPISQCPVIILRKDIAASFSCSLQETTLSESNKNIRIVPYNTPLGRGILTCIRADEALIKKGDGKENLGDVYVGISDSIECDALVGSQIISRCV